MTSDTPLTLLPTPTASDADRHTLRACWRPGRNRRGMSLVNALMDAPDIRLLPTPTTRDHKGANQRGSDDCLPVAVLHTRTHPASTPARFAWALDDGTGVDWGVYGTAIRRWERILDRPAPCPLQATDALRRWLHAHRGDPLVMCDRLLARRLPADDARIRLDDPMRRRVMRRWRSSPHPMIDPTLTEAVMGDPLIPLPATRMPDPLVQAHWRRLGAPRSMVRHSPRFVEWMMGLPDGHVTDPAIWRNVKGSAYRLQLRALGNGVVPAQAALAVSWALDVRARLSDTQGA